ncbi:MAG: hypothetical protein K8M05_41625, partial [Deltaproteobacteria bacterium]|nr:hypothetical protein [Kofleriaceae bacterium]
ERGAGAALGAGGWNGLRAQDLTEQVESASGAWSTDLDQAVQDGEDADARFQLLVPVGGAAALFGLFALGFGEDWSTDRRDARALTLRMEGGAR